LLRCAIALAFVVIGAGAGAAQRLIAVDIVRRRVNIPDNTIRVSKGDQVELDWTTDEETTIHVHGYDISLALEPRVQGTMRFEAKATGRFPVSAHGFGNGAASHREVVLLYLEVHPR